MSLNSNDAMRLCKDIISPANSILAALILLFLFPYAHANSAQLGANVTVNCPFSLSIGALPAYVVSNSINLNYTVFAQSECTVQSMSGTFKFISSNSTVVLQAPESTANVNQTGKTVPFVISVPGITPGNYTAKLVMSGAYSSNSSSAVISIRTPANILITNFTVSGVSAGSALQVFFDLSNIGSLASSQITANMIVAGPAPFSYNVAEPAISPGQMEAISFTLSGMSGTPGTYGANVTAYYSTYNSQSISNTGHSTYVVTTPNSGSPTSSSGGLPPSASQFVNPPSPASSLSLIDMPLYTYIPQSTQVLQNIGIKNDGKSIETAYLSLPKSISSFVTLSATSITIAPNSTVYVQMSVNTSSGQQGLFVIPVNISTTRNGKNSSITEYSILSVSSSSPNSPSVSAQITLQNSTKLATVALKLVNTKKTPITNATLTSYLPLALVSNASDIFPYGLPSNITVENNTYAIKFFIPYLASNQTVSMYYQIKHPISQTLLTQINNNLVQQYVPPITSEFNVFDITLPTLYSSSNGSMSAYLLYTGTIPRQVYVSLIAPSGVAMPNSTQVFTVSPNQMIHPMFAFSTGNYTGTIIFNFKMYSGNWNASYFVPGIVLQKQQSGQNLIPGISLSKLAFLMRISTVVVVAIALVIYFAIKIRKRIMPPRSNIINELGNIRNQMDRPK